MTRFLVEIELGNAAMQTGADVATALRKVAQKVEDEAEHDVVTEYEGEMPIMDENGNTVGKARFTDEAAS